MQKKTNAKMIQEITDLVNQTKSNLVNENEFNNRLEYGK